MRALVQRVTEGHVFVKENSYLQRINKGMVILLGVSEDDAEKEVLFVSEKCANLRIFEDENQKMNLSVKDVNGEVLIISQFTLYGDAKKGNRPSYSKAAKPELADKLYKLFIDEMKRHIGDSKIKQGVFGAMMEVKIINDGPVTLLVESK
ncbi:MAG: D-tyrosyl-tRNA(Tyr) deacylase [Ignavibacteriales bacterium]|nr:D-tyrosyl-tRNA(Tyr) deacylase [Ignavibacteriales bacterium]